MSKQGLKVTLLSKRSLTLSHSYLEGATKSYPVPSRRGGSGISSLCGYENNWSSTEKEGGLCFIRLKFSQIISLLLRRVFLKFFVIICMCSKTITIAKSS
uniref:Uncharacterized protein n=1 Tax=Cyprinodon variegatus TaxID=28743 RepID=A0A3Q2E4I3_CYPVA